MKKKCSRCGNEKSISEFSFRNKKKNKRQSACKKCHNALTRNHYEDNVEYYVKKAKTIKQNAVKRNRQKVFEYLLNHPCVDCGEEDPVVLQFDHVRGSKKCAVSMLLYNSWKLVEEEIAKCEIRCANCHARKTAKQQGYWHPDN